MDKIDKARFISFEAKNYLRDAIELFERKPEYSLSDIKSAKKKVEEVIDILNKK